VDADLKMDGNRYEEIDVKEYNHVENRVFILNRKLSAIESAIITKYYASKNNINISFVLYIRISEYFEDDCDWFMLSNAGMIQRSNSTIINNKNEYVILPNLDYYEDRLDISI
jgi:hypothetical protein